jgi:hypothetical protein
MASTIFVSYCTLDFEKYIQPLANILRRSGYDVIVYFEDNPPQGDVIVSHIEASILDVDLFLVADSPNARKSAWVSFEMMVALHHKKAIYRCQIDDCLSLTGSSLMLCMEQQLSHWEKLSVDTVLEAFRREFEEDKFPTALRGIDLYEGAAAAALLSDNSPSDPELFAVIDKGPRHLIAVLMALRQTTHDQNRLPSARQVAGEVYERLFAAQKKVYVG